MHSIQCSEWWREVCTVFSVVSGGGEGICTVFSIVSGGVGCAQYSV